MSNLSRLRKAVRSAKLPDDDAAGVAFAELLAELLDKTTPRTLTQVANGERDMLLEDRLTVIKIAGPQYLRTLTALGLTRAGRGAVPASSIPTSGSAAGVSQEAAAHERHRQRFSERRTGG